MSSGEEEGFQCQYIVVNSEADIVVVEAASEIADKNEKVQEKGRHL